MSYWCSKQIVVEATRGNESLEFAVDTPFIRIGSHPKADIVLPGTPKLALYLHATETGIFALPLVEAEAAQNIFHGWIDEDESVNCGPWQLAVRFSDWSPMLPATHLLDDHFPAGKTVPVYAIKYDGRVVARHRQRQALMRLGRTRPSDLRLRTSYVSTCHCIAYWDGRYVWVVDLCSTNGTRKNGRRFHAARLRRDRSIALGQVDLKFESLDEIVQSSRESHSASGIELHDHPLRREEAPSVPTTEIATPGEIDRSPPSDEEVAAADAGSPPIDSQSKLVDGQRHNVRPAPPDFAAQETRLAQWETRLLAMERSLVRQMAENSKQSVGLAEWKRKATLTVEQLLWQTAAAHGALVSFKEQESALSRRVLELDQRQSELDAFFATLSSQQETLDATKSALEERASELEGQAQLASEFANQQRQLEQTQEQLQLWEEKLAERETELTSQLEHLEQERRDLAKRRELLEEAEARQQASQQQFAQQWEQQNAQLAKQATQLQQREQAVVDLETKLREQQALIDCQLSEIDASRQDIAQETARHNQAKQEWEVRDAAWQRQADELEQRHRQLAEQEERLTAWETKLQASQQRFETEQAEIQQQSLRRQQELKARQQELDEARRALTAAQQELADQQAKLTEQDQSLDTQRTRIAEKERQVQEHETRLLRQKEELLKGQRDLLAAQSKLQQQQLEQDAERERIEADRLKLEEQRGQLQAERGRLEALSIEQTERLLPQDEPSVHSPETESIRQTAGQSRPNRNRVAKADRRAASDSQGDEPLIDPQKMLEDDPVYDEFTRKLVEFGRKKRRRWFW